MGYDLAISREAHPDLAQALVEAAPEGIDIFFDNVGGSVLNTVMQHLQEGARLVLCGAISQYEAEVEPVSHTWELITKRAHMEGFMFSDYIDEFPAVIEAMEKLLRAGELKTFDQCYQGIEQTPTAFCDMMSGASRGKCLVVLED